MTRWSNRQYRTGCSQRQLKRRCGGSAAQQGRRERQQAEESPPPGGHNQENPPPGGHDQESPPPGGDSRESPPQGGYSREDPPLGHRVRPDIIKVVLEGWPEETGGGPTGGPSHTLDVARRGPQSSESAYRGTSVHLGPTVQ